jgi:hypothetical protein
MDQSLSFPPVAHLNLVRLIAEGVRGKKPAPWVLALCQELVREPKKLTLSLNSLSVLNQAKQTREGEIPT